MSVSKKRTAAGASAKKALPCTCMRPLSAGLGMLFSYSFVIGTAGVGLRTATSFLELRQELRILK